MKYWAFLHLSEATFQFSTLLLYLIFNSWSVSQFQMYAHHSYVSSWTCLGYSWWVFYFLYSRFHKLLVCVIPQGCVFVILQWCDQSDVFITCRPGGHIALRSVFLPSCSFTEFLLLLSKSTSFSRESVKEAILVYNAALWKPVYQIYCSW